MLKDTRELHLASMQGMLRKHQVPSPLVHTIHLLKEPSKAAETEAQSYSNFPKLVEITKNKVARKKWTEDMNR